MKFTWFLNSFFHNFIYMYINEIHFDHIQSIILFCSPPPNPFSPTSPPASLSFSPWGHYIRSLLLVWAWLGLFTREWHLKQWLHYWGLWLLPQQQLTTFGSSGKGGVYPSPIPDRMLICLVLWGSYADSSWVNGCGNHILSCRLHFIWFLSSFSPFFGDVLRALGRKGWWWHRCLVYSWVLMDKPISI